MQLSFVLWPQDCLRGCLQSYMAAVTEKIANATMKDYHDRIDWLCLMLGNATPITQVSFARLEGLVKEMGPKGRGLKMVTLRKRLRLLRSALTYAQDHGLLDKVPRLPPQLHDDGKRGQDFYTVDEYLAFRSHVPDGAYRRFFDMGFWTGHHSFDIRRATRQWLDPEYPWLNDDGKILSHGRYWRENHKNKRCKASWLAAEPEFRILMAQWIDQNPGWQDGTAIVGRAWVTQAARTAAAESGLHYVTPNLGMRRSFATMLVGRGWPTEYIRQALGHEGESWIEQQKRGPMVHTSRPTTASAHYMRNTTDAIIRKLAAG